MVARKCVKILPGVYEEKTWLLLPNRCGVSLRRYAGVQPRRRGPVENEQSERKDGSSLFEPRPTIGLG
jgi:hypothetical protein